MPILRKPIHPEMLPVLARAQWNLAAHIMRRAAGGDIIAKVALPKFRFLAEVTEDSAKLCKLTGTEEVYVVAFYDSVNATFTDRQVIDWAVEFTDEDDPESMEFAQLRDEWAADEWKEWGR